jgi:DNA-binding winged helix-turn-helix (wHTH) protein
MHAQSGEQRFTFGPFCLDLRSATLCKGTASVRVPEQCIKLLAALLENPGSMVSREELRARLWASGTHVEFDQGLNSSIKRLRAALGDSAAAPRYIETLPKRGYRFIYPIQTLSVPREPADAIDPTHVPDVSPKVLQGSTIHASRKPRITFKLRILLGILSIAAVISLLHVTRSRQWAHQDAIPRAKALAEKADWEAAYDLACAAAAHLPANDGELQSLWPLVSRELAIVSEPSDAEAFWRPYAHREAPWRRLGRTPLHSVRVEAGTVLLRLSKDGYSNLEIAAGASNYDLQLERTGQHTGMVHIPAGPLFGQYSGLGKLGPVIVEDFWIDRNEVTNREFQEFVNAGGYRNGR